MDTLWFQDCPIISTILLSSMTCRCILVSLALGRCLVCLAQDVEVDSALSSLQSEEAALSSMFDDAAEGDSQTVISLKQTVVNMQEAVEGNFDDFFEEDSVMSLSLIQEQIVINDGSPTLDDFEAMQEDDACTDVTLLQEAVSESYEEPIAPSKGLSTSDFAAIQEDDEFFALSLIQEAVRLNDGSPTLEDFEALQEDDSCTDVTLLQEDVREHVEDVLPPSKGLSANDFAAIQEDDEFFALSLIQENVQLNDGSPTLDDFESLQEDDSCTDVTLLQEEVRENIEDAIPPSQGLSESDFGFAEEEDDMMALTLIQASASLVEQHGLH